MLSYLTNLATMYECIKSWSNHVNKCNQLSAEIDDAVENEKAIVFQMDGNLWGGSELIKNDPKKQNNNGLRFQQFLEKYPFLTVVNNLDLCQGSITRKRIM